MARSLLLPFDLPRARPAGPEVRIGTSGFRYPPWRGTFYPEGLAQWRELEYLSRKLRTVEINGSFYSLQKPSSYEAWRDQTPADFVFALKGTSYVTHNKKLRDPEIPLANFFASGVLALGPKLGPILWQLPPYFQFDADRVRAFLHALPRTTVEAACLGALHDGTLGEPAYLRVDEDRPIRHALEVRHPSFVTSAFLDLLRDYGVAACVADTAGRYPCIEAVTADFTYVRLHGGDELYVSGYDDDALDDWHARIERLRRGDVFVYFDNDTRARAPFDAMNLAARFGQGERVPFPHEALARVEARRGVEQLRTSWPGRVGKR